MIIEEVASESFLLIFEVSGRVLGARASEIREVNKIESITRIPILKKPFIGFTNLHGDVVTLLDIGTMFFNEECKGSFLITVDYSNEHYGIMIERVVDVIRPRTDIFIRPEMSTVPEVEKYTLAYVSYKDHAVVPIISLENVIKAASSEVAQQ
ncbi:MAG: chemotaxis protein CheW [Euryarchaeota archaeon]|nr:chemotaxis protein CheW [Euryarchaeota archaeon]